MYTYDDHQRYKYDLANPHGSYDGWKAGLKEKAKFAQAFMMAKLQAIDDRFTEAEKNAGFVSAAIENERLGYSND